MLQCIDSIEIEKHIGIEYFFKDMVGLRAGYKAEYGFSSILLGVGLQIGDMRLDYALSLQQEIDMTYWISFTIW